MSLPAHIYHHHQCLNATTPINGVSYLSADLGVVCFSGAHLSTVAGAVAVLVGYALGFPAVVMAVFRGRLRRWRPGAAFLGGNISPQLACPKHDLRRTQWAMTHLAGRGGRR